MSVDAPNDAEHASLGWLATLLTPAALLGLLVLMQRLEQGFSERLIAKEITAAIIRSTSPEELERVVTTTTASLFRN